MDHSSFLYIFLILRLTFLKCDYFKKASKFFLVHGDEKGISWISWHIFSFSFFLICSQTFIDNFAGFCGRESINKNKETSLPTSGTTGHIYTHIYKSFSAQLYFNTAATSKSMLLPPCFQHVKLPYHILYFVYLFVYLFMTALFILRCQQQLVGPHIVCDHTLSTLQCPFYVTRLLPYFPLFLFLVWHTFSWFGSTEHSESVGCSVMSDSLWPHGPLACQAPLSMGFSRREYWSGLPCLFFKGFSWPRNQTHVSWIVGRFFTV